MTVASGVFVVEIDLYGREAALVAASANTIQMLGGAVAGVAIAAVLRREIGPPTASTPPNIG